MKARKLSTALAIATAGAVLVLPASPAAAGETRVNFDGGTPGAPCAFAATGPLRDKYAGIGIRFRGRNATDGGAILDDCSNFGVDARTGLRFLAFNNNLVGSMNNGGTPRGAQKVLFNRRQKHVHIWVSQGNAIGSPTFKLVGKRNGNTVRTTTATTNTNDYVKLEIDSGVGFDSVVLSVKDEPDGAWVADDLVVRR